MKLSKDDIKLFYKLHPALLFYANKQLSVVDGVPTIKRFRELSIEKKVEVRNVLYDHISLIDSFVVENSFNFSPEELEIVAGWKSFVKGRFFLVRYLKRYAVFLDESSPPRAYGVVALSKDFDEILGPRPPIMLETVLLPFKGRIVYDGFMAPYRIIFGGGVRRSLSAAYQEAKHRFGIITSLPLPKEGEREESDADLLRFYLRTKDNRERYWEEIEKMIGNDSNLLRIYHQEMGKIHARTYGKRLREMGVGDAWFAILEGVIIASGKTQDEAERILKDILPTEKRDLAYIFHFHLKRK